MVIILSWGDLSFAKTNDGPFTPTIPKSVQESQEMIRQKQNEYTRRLVPEGTRSVQGSQFAEPEPEDETTRPDSGEEPQLGIGRVRLPTLNMQRSQAQKKGSRKVRGPVDQLPYFVEKPPRGVAAYLGQTLELRAKAKSDRDEDVHLIWIVNSEVVCSGESCNLPLDGQIVDVGASVLTLVAFHTGGSVQSDHVIQAVQGSWKKGDVFDPDVRKSVSSRMVSGRREISFSTAKDTVFAQEGIGLQAFPGTFRLIGDIGRNLSWEGRMRTHSTGVLKIESPALGEWYVLKRSSVRLQQGSDVAERRLFIEGGGVRYRARRRADLDKQPQPLESAALETPEVRIIPQEGSDIFVVKTGSSSEEESGAQPDRKVGTRVIVVSGTAQIRLKISKKGKPNVYNLSPGLELFVLTDGEVIPLMKPDGKRMERLQEITVTPAELAARVAAINAEKAKSVDLKSLLSRVAKTLEEEDFFEVISELSPVLSRANEDPRLPFFMGVASQGLYQTQEAKKYLQMAHDLDPEFSAAAWELGLLHMEEKEWEVAADWFSQAEEHMPSDDPKWGELHYYSGVIDFQKKNDFSARSSFTRALWAPSLESSLKNSAGSFMKSLIERKGWGLVMPFGAQYDQNVLSLGGSESVPEVAGDNGANVPLFPGRSLTRTLAGAIFSSDTAPGAKESGTYFGYGAKLMAINNFPRGFSSLDVILADVNMSQTFLRLQEVPEDPKNPNGRKKQDKAVWKMSQSLAATLLDSSLASLALVVAANWQTYEVAVAYEASFATAPFGQDDSVTLTQSATWPLLNLGRGNLSLPVNFKQKVPFETTETAGSQLTFALTPTYNHMFGPRLSLSAPIKIEPLVELRTESTPLTITAGTGCTVTYFLTPWLIALPGATYDVILSDEKSELVHKPVFSLMMTALL